MGKSVAFDDEEHTVIGLRSKCVRCAGGRACVKEPCRELRAVGEGEDSYSGINLVFIGTTRLSRILRMEMKSRMVPPTSACSGAAAPRTALGHTCTSVYVQ